jgi:hypothetical protein
MTSPYGSFGNNNPQQWGQQPVARTAGAPEGGPVPQPSAQWGSAPVTRPAAQWGSAPVTPAPRWEPAPPPQWGPSSTAAPAAQPGQNRGATKSRSRRGSKLALTIAVPVVVLVALVGVLGFAWPGFLNKKVFDSAALQAGVTSVLTNNYQVNATNVTCPANQPVQVGSRFPCSLLVDGQQETVTVTVISGDGQFEVGRPQ